MATANLLRPPHPVLPHDPFPRPWSAEDFARMQDMGLFAGRQTFLAGETVMEHGADSIHPFVFTRKEYYALWSAGFFRHQRVQLIGGVIAQESRMNPPHAVVIQLATQVLQSIFGVGFSLRIQLPVDLGLISEPHPDLAVVTGTIRDYVVDHPKSAVLIVEVAESTLEDDTHKKTSLYAAGGILDYWVIDVTGRVIVFRDPKPSVAEPFGFIYSRVSAHGRDDTITPLAAPDQRVRVPELLP